MEFAVIIIGFELMQMERQALEPAKWYSQIPNPNYDLALVFAR